MEMSSDQQLDCESSQNCFHSTQILPPNSPHILLEMSGPEVICRICHQTASETDGLLSLCKCVSVVHKSCLENWLNISHLDHCEICLQPYDIIRRFGSIYKYLRRGMSQNKWRFLLVDLMWLICGMYVIVIMILNSLTGDYDCMDVLGYKYGTGMSAFLMLMNGMSVAAYISWSVFSVRYYSTHWRIWRRKTCRVSLVQKNGQEYPGPSMTIPMNEEMDSDEEPILRRENYLPNPVNP